MPERDDLQQAIRKRAFYIWLEEGRPDGRHEEHWRQAEKEITGERGGRGDEITPDEAIGEIKYAAARTLEKPE